MILSAGSLVVRTDTVSAGYNPGRAYFDRKDVKTAIHAPSSVTWSLCGERNVFNKHDPAGPEGEGDASPDPIQNVLPQVRLSVNAA
jgi:carboxypeptidase D